jgi:hypothetical protein
LKRIHSAFKLGIPDRRGRLSGVFAQAAGADEVGFIVVGEGGTDMWRDSIDRKSVV